jgi:hypothetical protein
VTERSRNRRKRSNRRASILPGDKSDPPLRVLLGRQTTSFPGYGRLPITLHPGRGIDSGGIEGSRQRD